MELTARKISEMFNGRIAGDPDAKGYMLAKIEDGKEGEICFFANPKYECFVYASKASIIIVDSTFVPAQEVTATMVKVDNPYICFAKLLKLFDTMKPKKKGRSRRASVSRKAKIGKGTYIGEFAVVCERTKIGDNCNIYPHVFIDANVMIGDNVTLYSGVKIYNDCVLGNNITIHSGTVIGSDGFGFAPKEDSTFDKIPQLGNVVIEDDVEIGSNCSIDRATMGSTILKRGVKLDNLIQIAHNVAVGENTVMAAQVGIAGSTKIGDNCMFGGQVGLVGHINIGNNVKFGSKAGVTKGLPDGSIVDGYPAMPITKFQRSYVVYRNLPELKAKVEELDRKVKALESE
jgi:UDP-3-O-[3-hydroxymyristoyl] glucosamine N-acyltransferase